jgi:hypothetical protein
LYIDGGSVKNFKLVEGCYVYGVMNDNAILMGLAEEEMYII